jgi:hypothetical protein
MPIQLGGWVRKSENEICSFNLTCVRAQQPIPDVNKTPHTQKPQKPHTHTTKYLLVDGMSPGLSRHGPVMAATVAPICPATIVRSALVLFNGCINTKDDVVLPG